MPSMIHDEEFGYPIAVCELVTSRLALFENGTLAKTRRFGTGGGRIPGEAIQTDYVFLYNDVSEIASLKKINSQWPDSLQTIMKKKYRSLLTILLAMVLYLLYTLSFDPTELVFIKDLNNLLRLILAGALLIGVVGLEFHIRDHFFRAKIADRPSLQLQLVYRSSPVNLPVKVDSFIDEVYEYHNGSLRFAFVLAMLYLPGEGNFSSDFSEFFNLVLGLTVFPYFAAAFLMPLFLMQSFSQKRKGQKRVNTLDWVSFFDLAQQQIALAKPNLDEQRKKTLSELIANDETATLEFKGSLWTAYNTKTYEPIKEQTKKELKLQDAVVKSIAAFLNTDGGTLLVGVKDKPNDREEPIVGIENDFRYLGKDRSVEEFGHAMIQILNDAFGDQTTMKLYVDMSFPSMNGKTVCRLDVQPLPRVRNGELWTKTKTMGEEEFFYRVSDTTTHASAKSANRYIRHHFEGFSESTEENQST